MKPRKSTQEPSGLRGSGRTTAQLLAIKPGGVFIWCNDLIHYPKALAKKLGREDIKIYPLCNLENTHKFVGMKVSEIIVDHAATLTPKIRETLQILQHYMAR